MILTQINPYIFGTSFVIKYDVSNKKGIVRALSGDTSERSQYFTDFNAVTVAIAPNIEEENNIRLIFPEILGNQK
jgi:subtilase family serine protease